MEGEDNTTSQQEDTIKIRIAVTVSSGIGVLIAGIILVVLVAVKAYKSFLQRLFMWIILLVLVHDMCRVAGIYYEFCDGSTVSVLHDNGCEALGFITRWTNWCTYMFVIAILLYLHL